MDSKTFAKVLVEYAKRRPSNSSDFEAWKRIAIAFGSAKKEEVTAILSRAAAAKSTIPNGDGLYPICQEARLLAAFAQSVGKAPLADALLALAATVEANPSLTIDCLEVVTTPAPASAKSKAKAKASKSTEPTDPAVVGAYLKRLEESLGDEQGFAEVLADLEGDKRLQVADYKSIAKTFSGAAGTSKKKALDAIERRNRLLIDARMKSEMNAGKTAA